MKQHISKEKIIAVTILVFSVIAILCFSRPMQNETASEISLPLVKMESPNTTFGEYYLKVCDQAGSTVQELPRYMEADGSFFTTFSENAEFSEISG